jgi:hypothetical protein
VPDIQPSSFGLVIAFLAPGIVGLWGIGLYVPIVREWFGATAQTSPTGGGFLFVTLASLAVGLLVSGVREELLNSFPTRCADASSWWHRKLPKLSSFIGRLAIPRPPTDMAMLREADVRIAIQFSADSFYRYYQFYANMAFSLALTAAAWSLHGGPWSWTRAIALALVIITVVLLLQSSRYSQKMYYSSLEGIFRARGEGGTESNE